MYSQDGEDDIILGLVEGRAPACVLDIGAFDGWTFSNARALIDRGWSAVLVEPAPDAFAALLRRWGNTPRVACVNCAVEVGPGALVNFYDSGGDMLSTTAENSDHHRHIWGAAGTRFTAMWLRTIGLAELLDQFASLPIEVMSIDVEGKSATLALAVATAFVGGSLRELRVLCVEHDGRADEIVAAFAPVGFIERWRNGINLIVSR